MPAYERALDRNPNDPELLQDFDERFLATLPFGREREREHLRAGLGKVGLPRTAGEPVEAG